MKGSIQKNRTQALRNTGAGLVLCALFLHSLAFVHVESVRHEICHDHGEAVHADEPGSHCGSADPGHGPHEPVPSVATNQDSNHHDDHHCRFATLGMQRTLSVEEGSSLDLTGPARFFSPPAAALRGCFNPMLLLLAPKNSPPA